MRVPHVFALNPSQSRTVSLAISPWRAWCRSDRITLPDQARKAPDVVVESGKRSRRRATGVETELTVRAVRVDASESNNPQSGKAASSRSPADESSRGLPPRAVERVRNEVFLPAIDPSRRRRRTTIRVRAARSSFYTSDRPYAGRASPTPRVPEAGAARFSLYPQC